MGACVPNDGGVDSGADTASDVSDDVIDSGVDTSIDVGVDTGDAMDAADTMPDVPVDTCAAEELVCDGMDDDCDDIVDEGVLINAFRDADGDGSGDVAFPMSVCELSDGVVDNSDDCDDTCEDCFPGATETCNGRDEDCDDAVDEMVLRTFYLDSDGDSFGDPDTTMMACRAPEDYVNNRDDCNDSCSACNPDRAEICDGKNNDCDEDGRTDEDFDCRRGVMLDCLTTCGSTGRGRCSDTCETPRRADCTPPAEVCNYADDDCDGEADNGVSRFSPSGLTAAMTRDSTRTLVVPIEVSNVFVAFYCADETVMGQQYDAAGTPIGDPEIITTTAHECHFDADVLERSIKFIWPERRGARENYLHAREVDVYEDRLEVLVERDLQPATTDTLRNVAIGVAPGEMVFAYERGHTLYVGQGTTRVVSASVRATSYELEFFAGRMDIAHHGAGFTLVFVGADRTVRTARLRIDRTIGTVRELGTAALGADPVINVASDGDERGIAFVAEGGVIEYWFMNGLDFEPRANCTAVGCVGFGHGTGVSTTSFGGTVGMTYSAGRWFLSYREGARSRIRLAAVNTGGTVLFDVETPEAVDANQGTSVASLSSGEALMVAGRDGRSARRWRYGCP